MSRLQSAGEDMWQGHGLFEEHLRHSMCAREAICGVAVDDGVVEGSRIVVVYGENTGVVEYRYFVPIVNEAPK